MDRMENGVLLLPGQLVRGDGVRNRHDPTWSFLLAVFKRGVDRSSAPSNAAIISRGAHSARGVVPLSRFACHFDRSHYIRTGPFGKRLTNERDQSNRSFEFI